MAYGCLTIRCEGIQEGGKFPLANTGRGEDLSPAITLCGLEAAKTLAVTLEDLSHPLPGFTHWLIWNLPAADTIPANIPAGKTVLNGASQGIAYGLHRYAGPKPPRGRTHTYRFTVYALDCELNLRPRSRKRDLLRAARDHILQTGTLTASFE